MKHLDQGHQQKVHIEGRRFDFHASLQDNQNCAALWKKKYGGQIIVYKNKAGAHIPHIIALANSPNDWSEVDDSDCREEVE